jgi:CheY-like chemotaxis protein
VLYENGLIAALQWLAGRSKEQFQLEVELDLDPEAEPRSVELRAILFESVRELLFNIRKHAGVNRARIELSRSDRDDLYLAVEDEGVGFDPARAEASGRGLGLLRVRERMIALGGQADIDSVPGHGTRVLLVVPEQDICFPRVEQVVYETPADLQRAEVSGTVASGLIRVIVADDHRMVREGLVMILESQPDISVVGQADDGRETIELARALRPDVIVMDVNMPKVSGIEATRTILGDLPETVIIGVSAYDDSGAAESIKKAGAVAFLEKGGEPDELVLAVRQYVAERSTAA